MFFIIFNVVYMMSFKVFYIFVVYFVNDGGVNYVFFKGYNDNIFNL